MPFHPRNKHQGVYDWEQLCEAVPPLQDFLITKKDGKISLNYGHPEAVYLLNKALLAVHYKIKNWPLPEEGLCPPIPSRADYLHHLADLLGRGVDSPPQGKKVKILDVGVGASCIYPILGSIDYGWSFVGSDISMDSIQWAHNFLLEQPRLRSLVTLRLQEDAYHIFEGVVKHKDYFDAVICNPPFFKNAEKALAQQKRKWRNLGLAPTASNFGGKAHELYCKGGEVGFIKKMIAESEEFKAQVGWFTTLVAQERHLKFLHKSLDSIQPSKVETIAMVHGNKKSRILCWSF